MLIILTSTASAESWRQLNHLGVTAAKSGRYSEAVEYLRVALEIKPQNKIIRQNLVNSLNALGAKELSAGNADEAIKVLREASVYLPDDKLTGKNLSAALTRKAYSLYSTQQFSDASEYLDEAIQFDEENFSAWMLAGNIAYNNQELEDAESYWRRALSIDPDSQDVKVKLKKLQKEEAVEDKFRTKLLYNFDLKYEKNIDTTKVYDVLGYLRDAYRQVGRQFKHYPDHKIVVLLYPLDKFQELGGNPHWVYGLYDGKIRLPIVKKDNLQYLHQLETVVYHEYTHVLIHDLTGNRCPAWLNEGLAQYMEPQKESPRVVYLKRAVRGNRLIPLRELEGTFLMLGDLQKVRLAYEESLSVVNFIIEHHRFSSVLELLERLHKGENLAAVIEDLYTRGRKGLEERWGEWLGEEL